LSFLITAKGYDVFIPKTIVPTRGLRNFFYLKTNTLSECAARCLSEDDQRMKIGFVALFIKSVHICTKNNDKENLLRNSYNCIGFRFHNLPWYKNHCSFFNYGSEAITTYNKSLGTGKTVYTNSKYLKSKNFV